MPTVTFGPGAHAFVVPNGITSLTIDLAGGKGGDRDILNAPGGNGGRAQGSISVAATSAIELVVGAKGFDPVGTIPGGRGTDGGAGGKAPGTVTSAAGGGNSTRIFKDGTLVAVAAGGGGGAGLAQGGIGGGLTGGDGFSNPTETNYGRGGTQTAGGMQVFSEGTGSTPGTAGVFQFGGNGGSTVPNTGHQPGGGGGGGFFGGGGGGANDTSGGGGGGGSSYIAGLTGGSTTSGFRNGDGYASLTYATPIPVPDPTAPFFVVVSPPAQTVKRGQNAVISVIVLNYLAEGLSGKTVTLEILSGTAFTFVGSTTTLPSGTANFTRTQTTGSTPIAEVYRVTVVGYTPQPLATIEWLATPVPTRIVAFNPAQARLSGELANISIRTVDQYGDPISATVNWSIFSGTSMVGVAQTAMTTDASGNGTLSYTKTVTTETVDRIAADFSTPVTVDDTIAEVTWRPLRPAVATITPAHEVKTSTGTRSFTVKLVDQLGAPVPVVTIVYEVTEVPLGGLVASGSGPTNAAGEVTFSYARTVGAGEAFEDLIEAYVLGESIPKGAGGTTWGSASPPPPFPVVITSDSSDTVQTKSTGQVRSITFNVKDQNGNNLSGAAVVVEVKGANPQSPSTLTTNASGNVTYTYTGTNPGNDTIIADVTGTGS